MKVLQIHNKYRHYGGEDAVVDNEYRLLKEHGFEVRQLFFDNSEIGVSKLFHNSKAYQQLLDEVSVFKPDVIHVHNIFYNASPSVLKAAKKAGIPLVMTIHNYRLLCTGALFLRDGKACTKCKDLLIPYHGIRYKCFQDSLSKSLVLSTFLGWQKILGTWDKYIDRFVVLTPFIRELFISSKLQIREDRIVVKPNSTDDVASADTGPKREGFVFVGRLSEEKGVKTMIEAFNQIPDINLAVIGSGELESQLKSSAKKNITFYGKQNKEFIVKALKRSKALIFPSIWYEGLPNTVIEAFSSGTPVIASDMENINQLVTNGYNGILFKTNDASDLAEKTNIFNAEDTTDYQKASRKTYETVYTHEKNFNNLKNLYTSLI